MVNFAELPLPCDAAVAAAQLVDAMHSAAVLPPELREYVKSALGQFGVRFALHPLWLHVSTAPPHHGVLRRLATIVGITWPAVHTDTGFSGRDEFTAELRNWVAWYSVVRCDLNIRSQRAASRASALLESGVGGVDVDALTAASCDAVTSDSEDEADPGPREPDDSHSSQVVGITSTPKIAAALANACDDVVVDGLLANQKMEDIPKGTPVFACQLCAVCSPCPAFAGTCSNEAVHQYLRQSVFNSSTSVDMLEVFQPHIIRVLHVTPLMSLCCAPLQVNLGYARLCYNDIKLRREDHNHRNKLLVALQAAMDELCGVVMSDAHALSTLPALPSATPFRTLDEVKAAGFAVRCKVGDPFSQGDAAIVRDCLTR